ncbi:MULTISPECIES: hypothetical protein [unclassified Pseudomonas]|uniref:hypothetical protein n=1 Tax=unclassified Pseudomonas TaxID=196821 RepID=UPI00119EB39F|nr:MULTISPECIES: hypothetical protein [unclassified Pseudomonas]
MDDPLAGTIEALTFALSSLGEGGEWEASDEEIMLEAFALVSSLSETGRISVTALPPTINSVLKTTCSQLQRFLIEVRSQVEAKLRIDTNQRKLDQMKNHFSVTLNNAFGYEFTDGDLKRIQQLLNELREMVSANTELDADHKQRLLKRLEEMQREMHKKVSDLSRLYGLIGDAGVMLGKLGTNAKPLVDRIKELAGIAWTAQARAEELPSGSDHPMLGNDSEPPAIE